ncbi:division/cell wall cluster transcriptional repressor MraZ [Candidatus Daviesbacteria bacterium RIFCSPHIGHO2_02_FULL_36_13]|uniref:Transcriptional regulator MraZ n=1 Tax=Candidatus Daviesbacteria bacterium RIFCSPHIGHO2_02_FULL_36_13 TaxID=1797768 RepID=A0A1F5JNM5_9BACT|nr:MAG: division/cell wall cluster transcriptional repressor MraZ [Candidatus Daviesbacteria bacterium RIFCSPHIGHO2_02_FULL_36_13]
MFLGEYKLKFTGKGRVILPKKMRDEITGREVVLSRGFEECIFGYDLKSWKIEAEKQFEISNTEERGRTLRRYMFSASVPVELDAQGRFVIPSALLTYAKVGREIVIIGAGDHFEIWNNKLWEKYLKEMEGVYGRVS